MSNDTAAFFASKKKKKGFKFNANLVDADALLPRDHVDAPAISTDGGMTTGGAVDSTTDSDKKPQQEEWDDAPLAASDVRKATSAAESVRDMKSLDISKGHSGNIAEKLRVEETKAQLAAAREGMEREAKLLKEKKEADEAKKQEVATRFSGAASNMGVTGKWMPPSLARVKMGSSVAASGGGNRRFNVEDEELFPDLAAAGKILEQKEKEQQIAFKPVKKTPVGGGASWASKPPATKAVAPEPEPEHAPSAETETASTDPVKAESPVPSVPQTSAPSPAEPSSAPKIAPMKKKKKDLSTFKVNA